MKMRWVVGTHAVAEAIRVRPHACTELWVRKDLRAKEELRSVIELGRVARVKVKEKALADLNQLATSHQGIACAIAESPIWTEPESAHGVLVMLDHVTDPQNLGAIMRTAWLFGVSAIFTADRRAASGSPAAFKVASGGGEHVPLVETHLLNELKSLGRLGYQILGCDMNGGVRLDQVELSQPTVWVLGSEDKGLSKPLRNLVDTFVSLPQSDPRASLNVGATAAIVLHASYLAHI